MFGFGKKKSSGRKNRDVIAALDLGTSKTSVLIAEKHLETLNLIGFGCSPSLGMKQGVVVNIEQTVDAILKAVEAAERMADVSVEAVFCSMSGDHLRSTNVRGAVPVSKSKSGLGVGITREDMQRAVELAQGLTVAADREILHVIPQDYQVDDREESRDPAGLVGARLEARAHVITAAQSAIQTILRCLEEAELAVEELVGQSLASSLAVLTPDERELGVALVDLGGGTVDMAVYFDHAIRHTAVIGLGGDDVTRDLALGLRIPVSMAQKIKLEYGCTHQSKLSRTEPIILPGVEDRPDRQVAQDIVWKIIQARMEEIFDLTVKELRQAEVFSKLTLGVVLTGGGALLPGTLDLAGEVFNLPVRLGRPRGLVDAKELCISPDQAAGVGLLLFASQWREAQQKIEQKPRRGKAPQSGKEAGMKKLKRKLEEFF
jgi:cell division protein FtsA